MPPDIVPGVMYLVTLCPVTLRLVTLYLVTVCLVTLCLVTLHLMWQCACWHCVWWQCALWHCTLCDIEPPHDNVPDNIVTPHDIVSGEVFCWIQFKNDFTTHIKPYINLSTIISLELYLYLSSKQKSCKTCSMVE